MGRKALHLIPVALFALAAGLAITLGCGGTSKDDLAAYGGSDPEGDFIVVILDRTNMRVKHINYTEGETEETQPWYDYYPVPAGDPLAQGFSNICRVDVEAYRFVLFVEFPDAALMYQMFDSSGGPPVAYGNPVYAVCREPVDKSAYYAKAYNWMRFCIDADEAPNSDMGAGFAAFDARSARGLLYGASYSKRRDEDDGIDGCGIENINSAGTVEVDDFTYVAETSSNILWSGGVGDWSRAVALTGTGSGAVVLDFGPESGGGMGLAIPQTSLADDAPAWWSTVQGVYFTMVYEYDPASGEARVSPMKIVVDASGNLKAFLYEERVSSGTPVFDQPLEALGSFDGGPNDEPICDTFAVAADNQAAAAAVVRSAHLCKGGFLAEDGENDSVVFIMFDPAGRFFGFTMFDNEVGQTAADIRFGFGIRDFGYADLP